MSNTSPASSLPTPRSEAPTVAYCFYGQYRTADYCLPWIAATVSATSNVRGVFVSTKLANTYPNVSNRSNSQLSDSRVITRKLTETWPDAVVHVDPVVHLVLDPAKGYWNYSRLFWSLNKVYQMYCQWALEHGDVDLLVFHRLDALAGPRPDTIGNYLRRAKVTPYELWVDNGHIRFHFHEFGNGISDLTLVGSPFALGTLLSYTTQSLAHRPTQGWSKFMHGPNIHLLDAAHAASLSVNKLAGETALVRPTADLTIPVFESFEYHAKNWKQDHKGSNKGRHEDEKA